MKYLITTRETELWWKRYMVEASSGDDAIEKLNRWDSVENYDDVYEETIYSEIVEVEPYKEFENETK